MVRLGKSLLSSSSSQPSSSRQRSTAAQSSSQAYSSSNGDIPDSILIPLLAQKSYHLPGNSWRQDWVQWMKNNHIVFGICFCDKLHPIEWWERIIVMLGSMSFALIAINIYYLLWDWDEFVFNDETATDAPGFDPESELYSITIFGTTYAITQGMIVLWTFGGLLHSVFDFTVWQTSACACCHPGGRCYDRCSFCSQNCNDLGSYVLVPIVMGVMALAVYSSYVRTNYSDDDEKDAATAQTTDDLYNSLTGGTLGQFSFLVKYFVELFLAWFFYFPIFGTVMFSGILGCGRLPILGGRPRDKASVEKELADHAQNGGDGLYSSF